MRGVRSATPREINDALEDMDRKIRQLRRGVGFDLVGGVISGAGDPVQSQDLVNKQYVDGALADASTTIIGQASGAVWAYLNQAPSGTMDGANTTFILPYSIYDSRVAIWHQHIRLKRVAGLPGVREFRLTGRTVLVGTPPASGDHFVADLLTPRPVNPVLDETPSGTKDGVNTVFTLAYAPAAPQDVAVYIGGALYELVSSAPGPDEYTLSGRTITLGAAPLSTDQFAVDYSVQVPGDIRWNDSLAGTKNGSNVAFTLDEEPLGDQIGIFMSHIRLKKVASPTLPTEYSISGKTVTVGLAPQEGEPLFAHYVVPTGGGILHGGPGWMIGSTVGHAWATTLADMVILQPEGLNGFLGGQN